MSKLGKRLNNNAFKYKELIIVHNVLGYRVYADERQYSCDTVFSCSKCKFNLNKDCYPENRGSIEFFDDLYELLEYLERLWNRWID